MASSGLTQTEAYDIQHTLENLHVLNDTENIIVTGSAELSTGRQVEITFDADSATFRAVV